MEATYGLPQQSDSYWNPAFPDERSVQGNDRCDLYQVTEVSLPAWEDCWQICAAQQSTYNAQPFPETEQANVEDARIGRDESHPTLIRRGCRRCNAWTRRGSPTSKSHNAPVMMERQYLAEQQPDTLQSGLSARYR
ncbi:hypothetical protein NUW54_g3535 [Trametes sanguinea]|uniref:Uncharacterized protein n=1 Tax=Trametes sanguinea TaxID=158606 RepID=A0ACC1Q307_9APHY|nr:hypothetical protein NUW54_g3535 [Trametes sanguinea]